MRKSDIKLIERFIENYIEPPFNKELRQPLMDLCLKLYTSGWVDGSNDCWDEEE